MCSRQAQLCIASCLVLSISKMAKTATTNFRSWSMTRNQNGEPWLKEGLITLLINSPQVGVPLLGSCGDNYWRNQAWGKVWPRIFNAPSQDKTYDSLWNQEFESKHDAQRDFEFQYEDKTGNKWKNRDNFQKVVGVFNHHLLYSFQVGGPKVFPPGYWPGRREWATAETLSQRQQIKIAQVCPGEFGSKSTL